MPRHHYLPACYLANFSLEVDKFPPRKRSIEIGDLSTGKLFSDSVEDVGCIKNLYTQDIEEIWSQYETQLPIAIERLIDGTLDGEMWARILVPFVAGLLVRGPDFGVRFEGRLSALDSELNSKDNTNEARLFELQRLLAPVIAAKWIVIHINGDENLITNDLGYTPFANFSAGDFGIGVPLGIRHVLAISPQFSRTIIYVDKDQWMPVIEYVEEPPNNQHEFNTVIARVAQRFIFGSDENVILSYMSSHNQPRLDAREPGFFGFIQGRPARAYEFTWHRLVSVLGQHPNNKKAWDFSIDWNIVANGWYPPVIYPKNLIEFPSALKRVKHEIKVKFYDPEIYYALSRIINYQQMGQPQLGVEEATKTLSRSIKKEDKYRILLARSDAYIDLELIHEALKDCQEAIKLCPKKAEAYIDQGISFTKLERFENSISSFTKAIAYDPSCGIAYLNRGSSLFEINKFGEAFDDLSEAIKLLPKGPTQAVAFFMRGNVLLQKNVYQDAAADFSVAFSLYPDSHEKANCLYHRAVAYVSSGNSTQAINDLSDSITLTPMFFDALSFRAQLYMMLNKYEEAIQDFDSALPIISDEKTQGRMYRKRAICYTELGAYQDANSDFEKALQLTDDNDRFNVSYDYGTSLLFQGYIRQAIEAFMFTLKNNPSFTSALNNMGVCNALQGKHNEAITYFDQAISNPGEYQDVASAYRNKAISHAMLGDFVSAEDAMCHAEVIAPDSAETYIARGRLWCFQREYSKSLETHLRVWDTDDPFNSNPFTSIALLALGDTEKAKFILQGWLSSKPNFVVYTKVLTDLEYIKRNSLNVMAIDILTFVATYANQYPIDG